VIEFRGGWGGPPLRDRAPVIPVAGRRIRGRGPASQDAWKAARPGGDLSAKMISFRDLPGRGVIIRPGREDGTAGDPVNGPENLPGRFRSACPHRWRTTGELPRRAGREATEPKGDDSGKGVTSV